MAFDMKDYVEVADRIMAWYRQFPTGSIRTEIVEMTAERVTVKAEVFRGLADDSIFTTAGVGHSSLAIPGLTPYTKGSELENAETSAVGRALVMAGIPSKSVASANEIRAKKSGGGKRSGGSAPTEWGATPSPGTPVEAGVSRGTGSHDGSSPATATDQVPSRSPSPASTSSDPAGNASFGEGGTSPAASGHFDKEAAIAEAVRLCGGDLGKLMTHVRAKHPEWKTDPTYPVGKYNDLQGFHYLQIIEDFAEAAMA